MNNTIADGLYKIVPPNPMLPEFVEVTNGRFWDYDSVEVMLQRGYTFEPAVVMTRAEYDATIARLTQERDEARQMHAYCTVSLIAADRQVDRLQAERDSLRAQVEAQGQICTVDDKPNFISRAQMRGLEASGYVLQRRTVGEEE